MADEKLNVIEDDEDYSVVDDELAYREQENKPKIVNQFITREIIRYKEPGKKEVLRFRDEVRKKDDDNDDNQQDDADSTSEKKLKVEICGLSPYEVNDRLSDYEKTKRKFKRRRFIFKLLKWGIIIAIAVSIAMTPAIKEKVTLIFNDVIEILQDVKDNKDTSSNKLVEDLFSSNEKENNKDEK